MNIEDTYKCFITINKNKCVWNREEQNIKFFINIFINI